MQERLSELAAGPRFNALLLVAFATVGLLLAAIGLYGTIAYLVAQRTQEIGIRMSLGATRARIAGLMLAHSAKWTLAGAAIGVLASLATMRLLSSLLFRVSAHDPLTLIVSVLCLLFARNPSVAVQGSADGESQDARKGSRSTTMAVRRLRERSGEVQATERWLGTRLRRHVSVCCGRAVSFFLHLESRSRQCAYGRQPVGETVPTAHYAQHHAPRMFNQAAGCGEDQKPQSLRPRSE
jgi:hypothetical protein